MRLWSGLFLACGIAAMSPESSAGNPAGAEPANASCASDEAIDLARIHGRIRVVQSFPDYRVKIVESFADLHVQVVESFPDAPGRWQMVESFPDHTIQFVDGFPDFTIKYVSSFPGVQ